MPLLRLAGLVPHLVFAAMSALLLYTVGRPLRTADAWLHLALGREYARQGPWLDADPLLYTATGPPTASAWLSDLALHATHVVAGFQGLRLAHVLVVASILALCHSLLRRAGGSPALASLAGSVFIVLGGYRLLQLRPHLVTILCTLLLYRLLLESREPPTGRRMALCGLLFGLWANAHAGFVLGPLLLFAALLGVSLEAACGPAPGRDTARLRARGLALSLALGLLATFANPDGAAPHLAYLRAGSDSPALAMVVDEWRPFPLFGPLRSGLPPSPLCFGIGWLLLVATPLLGASLLWRLSRGRATHADAGLLGVACAAVLAGVLAVRFQWLGVFSLLLALRSGRPRLASPRARVAAAIGAVALLPLWLRVGDWPRLSEDVPRDLAGYATPYTTAHYHGHATWFLRDASIEGHLASRYVLGNYLGYWLAPRLRIFFGGSLNVPPDVAEAYFALNDRRGLGAMSFEDTLDHYAVDVFMGVGIPMPATDSRPQLYTTVHLEGSPGWRLVFRNLRTSLWLRDGPRNASNLERVAAYYARAGVPFDPERGLDLSRVLEQAPHWAVQHGLVPANHLRLVAAAGQGGPQAQRRLASLYATLGLYQQAIEIDRELLARRETLGARRRLVWCLLHLGRGDEALRAAARFERSAPEGTLARHLASAARAYVAAGSEAERAQLVAGLRFLSLSDASALFAGVADAEARSR